MALPEGTVTLLLTEVAASTARWEESPDAMARAVAWLDQLVAGALQRHNGVLVKPRGEGDSHFTVFSDTADAVAAALDLAGLVLADSWPVDIKVKMAIHLGPIEVRDGDYYGPPVNRCARIRGVAHGGQIVLSTAAATALGDRLPDGATLKSLGLHFLKDLARPEQVLQLCHPSLPDDFPPLASLAAPGTKLPLPLTSLIGRDELLAELGATTATSGVYTLTGGPGTGKSRLALELAAVWLDEHPGHSVDVTPFGDDAVAITSDGLLVLDDVDRVLDDARAAIESAAPDTYVVVSCRRPLDIPSETVVTISRLQPEDAVRLLRERVSAVAPDVELDDDTAAAICARIDYLPLTIEMAAARVPVLPPAALLERLNDDLLRVLGGGRHGPAHHKSWRDALAWG